MGSESGLIGFWESILVHDLCIMAFESTETQFVWSIT